MKNILKKIQICIEIQNSDASDERKKNARKIQKKLSKMWTEKNLSYLKKVFGLGDSAPAITFDNRDKLIKASENSFFHTNIN